MNRIRSLQHLEVGLVIGLALLTGCEQSSHVGRHRDPERALATLTQALDAWKAGEASALAEQTPSIRFRDDDLAAGLELADYELEQPSVPILPFQAVKVALTLRDGAGQTSRKTVSYQVGVEPGLTVLRSDN